MTQPNLSHPYFAAFYRKNRLRFAAATLLSLLTVPFNLAFSWILGAALDCVTAVDADRLGDLFLFTVALTLLQIAVDLLRHRLKTDFVHRALARYKSLAFSRISQKSISAFSKEHTGRYISVLTNDVGSIEEKYLLLLFFVPMQALTFFATLFMMFWYSVPLTLFALAASGLSVAVSVGMSRELSKREVAVSDENEGFVARIKDLLAGFAVIKSFKAEDEAQKQFDADNRLLEKNKARRRWWSCFINVASWDVCGMLLQFGLFMFGAYLAIQGDITAGALVALTNLCNGLLQPVISMPEQLGNMASARALVKKLAALAEENTARDGDAIAPHLEDAIELHDLTYGYDPAQPVLKNLSLRLEKGKSYALVGASGSGKSTLLNLLMGGCEGYSGSAAIDGKELSSIAPDSLYDLMSLIGQNVFLFDDTIERNITMFREFPEEKVRLAAERAGLGELLRERGPDYRCGENGGGLSGGERQRIAIARSLLRDTPVLLLDEATAALDNRTAFAVTEAILHLDGLTRLVVTHRLEAELLQRYDRIFVLRSGTLWEQGTFDELMGEKGYFYSLYNVSAE